jgi:putative toxin-antitoxin system antitoxin component (TIGR02293 family)
MVIFKYPCGGFMELREYTPVMQPKDIWAELGLPNEDSRLREQIANGLPIKVLNHVASSMEMTQKSIIEALHIPPTTFLRRKKGGRLTTEESDKLYSLIEVLARSTDLFDGDRKAAVEWMTKKVPGLGHMRPIDMLDSHTNTEAVLDIITRLEYGVYS